LKGPAKLDSGCDDAAGDLERAGKLDREIRIEQSHFFNAVLGHQVNQLRDNSFRGEGIESPLVKHHVRAVIAGVGAADAGSISNFARPTEFLVRVKIGKVKRWNGERIQRF